jgi:hypothetical protein
VSVVRAPEVTAEQLTRVFKWQLTVDGKTTSDSCEFPVSETPVMSAVTSQAKGAGGSILPNEFTIVMTWNFPFDPAGVKVAVNGTVAEKVASAIHEVNEVVEDSRAGSLFKELGMFALSYVTAGKVVGAVRYATEGRKLFYIGETFNAAEFAAERVHNAHSGSEVLGILGGYLNFGRKEGAYPIMSVVLRGNFDTQLLNTSPGDKANRIPIETTLAVSAVTSNFPHFQLEITRTAPVNPRFETYNGLLPWTYAAELGLPDSGELFTTNPAFGDFSPYSLDQSDPSAYGSGEEQLKDLLSITQPTEVTARSYRLYGGIEGPLFGEIQSLAPAPKCTTKQTDPTAKSKSTICWQFDDGRA